MKIIITGASGSIGRFLVPYLKERGHELLLVGRNEAHLKRRYPFQSCCGYNHLPTAGEGFDACVHLAVMNNDSKSRIEDFRSANIELLKSVFDGVKSAGCDHFINLTSVHSGDLNRDGPYATSKQEADQWLIEQRNSGIRITSLRLPAVYSQYSKGNLEKINRLPKRLQPAALTFLGALKPFVDMERVSRAINDVICDDKPNELTIVNPADNNLVFSMFKKVIDWGFALSILFLFWWLLLVVFVAVKITSKGSAIFVQERVGQRGKIFTCYKFRTMRTGTKQVGTHDLGRDAITNIGTFLRKTKIDELPQVVNILRGELSVVGPRPCLPSQTHLVDERTRLGVTEVLPGITGWAQINDIDMSDPVRLAQADSEYIARRTIPFELSILMRTFFGAGRGDRVNSK